ncbi:MAG: bifunctional folylpolyglutamate synthase/dihydrofolate synthase [Bacteroidales bacterium]|nr:bifunctional folylpolyglutamate synthase/dihydrofolate synthase [Bacteroidales bacterium]
MTYKETVHFLYSRLPAYHRIGKAAYKDSLDNILALDKYFGHPHLKFKTIHVAGTNGKGSVSHMIASVLQEAGYRTGLYTSPHLRDFRERIRINGEMIPESEVVLFVQSHRSIIDSLKPSFFEMTVAMAFDYFAREKVDIAVIEVGLGGRLDSTNIIIPLISVITNIGHDHMDILGDTMEKVASEKAGIIKKGVPVVIGETQPETKKVFTAVAEEKGSEIIFADRNFSCFFEDSESIKGGRRYMINDLQDNRKYSGTIPLGGDYQQKNIQTLFGFYKSVKGTLKISERNLKEGIKKVVINTGLQGRWQILSTDPLTICDTGHNKEGLEYVIRQIMKYTPANLHLIIGFVSDKDLTSVLPLFPVKANYYFTKATVLRALDENELRLKASRYGLVGNSYPDVNMALKAAQEKASKDDLIFIGGSTFVVAEII